jgi:ribosome-associated protein
VTSKKKPAKKSPPKLKVSGSSSARATPRPAKARADKGKGDTKAAERSPGPAAKAAARKKAPKPEKKPAEKKGADRRAGDKKAGNGSDRALSPAASKRQQESRAAAHAAIDAALDKKGLVPVLIDVSGQASYTDYIGIVSGRSDRQVDAIAENVTQVMKDRGWRLLGREGVGNGRWTLLDFGDVILHVFYHPVREFYDIEGLWIDAPRIRLNVPPEAMHVQEDALYDTL